MEFAGFESGRATLDVRPADLGGIIEEALRGAEPLVREHHATIERRGPASLPAVLVDPVGGVTLAAEPDRQRAEVRRRAAGRRGRGAARRPRTRREVSVTVSDNGAGIAARDLPHIFEPFYRGGDATARQIHGSGLGLSLVKRIMDELGGRITVRTDAGKGSAFTLHLPLAPEGALAGSGGRRRPRPASAIRASPALAFAPSPLRTTACRSESRPHFRDPSAPVRLRQTVARGAHPHRRRRTRAGAHPERSARTRGPRRRSGDGRPRRPGPRARRSRSTCSCSTSCCPG